MEVLGTILSFLMLPQVVNPPTAMLTGPAIEYVLDDLPAPPTLVPTPTSVPSDGESGTASGFVSATVSAPVSESASATSLKTVSGLPHVGSRYHH